MKRCDKNRESISETIELLRDINQAGLRAYNEGEVDQAEANFLMALYVSKSIQMPCLEARALNNLGVFYASNNVWDQALCYYEQALSIVYSKSNRKNWLCEKIQQNMMQALRVT